MLRSLEKAIQTGPLPEAVFMLSLSEKILLTPWLAARGVKVFWIEHDSVGRWLAANPWLPALKKAASSATIVCVSALSKRLFMEIGFDPARIVVIPNGIPLDRFEPRRTHAPTQSIHIGTVARLSPEKGVDVLIQSVEKIPEATVTIVGRGREEGYLQTLIAEDTARLGIGNPRIKLVSSVPDLSAFYRSLDVFVLPSSDNDPFGLTAAEAMASGIATIVTDACGIAAELEAGVDSLVAEAGSPGSLAAALRTLCDAGRRKEMAEAGLNAARRRFGVDRMVEAYAALL